MQRARASPSVTTVSRKRKQRATADALDEAEEEHRVDIALDIGTSEAAAVSYPAHATQHAQVS
jgi:hypothetical protein